MGEGIGAVRVLVADDDPEVQAALADLVDGEPTLELVGVAAEAEEAVWLAEQCTPDVALVDVRMPGGGHQAVRQIRARAPSTRVLAFSAYGDHSAVVGMVASGAASYLVKGTSGSEVVEAIHTVVRGGSVLSGEATDRVVGELAEQLQRREQELLERERKVERIERALYDWALRIVYQPVVDLTDRRRCGVEALARFALEPERSPNLWFDEAGDVGLRLELELAAIRAALPVLDVIGEHEFLALNVSPETVCSPRFLQALPAACHRRLVVEVTEHARVDDYEELAGALEGLRRAGLRLAVDDAGAGYASLQHILRLAPDIIKLDMALTRNVQVDPRRRALVAALVPFAREIGATVIAEGIETEEERRTLRGFGAAWGQGYLLGRPGRL
jgi:EAL domain-containing protein (putative c-di-GMP-specific phosphodiesterase class I)